MNAKALRIDIWSDIVCPWCWIGKHRLGTALEGMGPVDIHWHPFLLDPESDASPVPLREAYEKKFGGPERVNQILSQTQATANAEGLPMDFDRGQVRVSTRDAHRVMLLAAAEGDAQAVGEALFRAHFEHGRNVADPDVLAEAAAAGGLPRERVLAMLDSDEFKRELEAAFVQAQRIGIRAVPTFVIDGQLAVQGAQPPEAFRAAFAQLGHQPSGDGNAASEDAPPACGPDGCTP